jgi:hypothetical protein
MEGPRAYALDAVVGRRCNENAMAAFSQNAVHGKLREVMRSSHRSESLQCSQLGRLPEWARALHGIARCRTTDPRHRPNPKQLAPLPMSAEGVLKRARHRSGAAGSRTRARIADDVAQQGARRIGAIAILTAVTVAGAVILEHALQPEMAAAQQNPLFRLSALFLVLAGASLAVLQRAELVGAQDLLVLGLRQPHCSVGSRFSGSGRCSRERN